MAIKVLFSGQNVVSYETDQLATTFEVRLKGSNRILATLTASGMSNVTQPDEVLFEVNVN